jgi:hypothetical protein
VKNAKSYGDKYQLFVLDVESFFSEKFTNSLLTTEIMAIPYFVAEIAKANGLENAMDLNRIPITWGREQNVNTTGIKFGKGTWKQVVAL